MPSSRQHWKIVIRICCQRIFGSLARKIPKSMKVIIIPHSRSSSTLYVMVRERIKYPSDFKMKKYTESQVRGKWSQARVLKWITTRVPSRRCTDSRPLNSREPRHAARSIEGGPKIGTNESKDPQGTCLSRPSIPFPAGDFTFTPRITCHAPSQPVRTNLMTSLFVFVRFNDL